MAGNNGAGSPERVPDYFAVEWKTVLTFIHYRV